MQLFFAQIHSKAGTSDIFHFYFLNPVVKTIKSYLLAHFAAGKSIRNKTDAKTSSECFCQYTHTKFWLPYPEYTCQ